jgi:ABC-type xylose transport system substrate-binding protein
MAAPISKATALANAATLAGQRGATAEQTARIVVQVADMHDSRWSRDPGRAHGPYS